MQPRDHEFLVSDSDNGTHRIAYVEWGDAANENVLFCVHGLTRNSRDFDFLAQALANHYRVICPDVPGRGKSEWLADKTKYNYGTYVPDMVALIESLGIKQLDWVGTSMGGLIGMTIAAFHPGLIRKLVLNDIGPFVPAAALKRIGKYVGQAPVFPDVAAAENYMRVIFSPFGIKEEAHWRHLLQYGVEKSADGGWRLCYDPAIAAGFAAKEMEDMDLWSVWEAIEAKALVLHGEMSDILLPETVRKMQEKGPKAELVEFSGVGHAPALMDVRQIDVVKDWLLK